MSTLVCVRFELQIFEKNITTKTVCNFNINWGFSDRKSRILWEEYFQIISSINSNVSLFLRFWWQIKYCSGCIKFFRNFCESFCRWIWSVLLFSSMRSLGQPSTRPIFRLKINVFEYRISWHYCYFYIFEIIIIKFPF